MMRLDEKSSNFYCTEIGRIASHFYVQRSSVETYKYTLDSSYCRCISESPPIELQNVVDSLRQDEQAMVFVYSPKDTATTA
ncbi:unnamed protein product [Prunus armeniaca]